MPLTSLLSRIGAARGGRRRGYAALVVVFLLLVAVLPAGAAGNAALKGVKFPNALRFHGFLDGIPGPDVTVQSPQVIGIDDGRNRMYVMYMDVANGFGPGARFFLNAYDLKTPGVPKLLSNRQIKDAGIPLGGVGLGGDLQPYAGAYVPRRQEALFAITGNQGARIDRLDVKASKALPPFNLSAEAPGFSPVGMTYAPEEDRLYLVGDLSGTAAIGDVIGQTGSPTRSQTAVVALDAKTGKRVWARLAPECQQPLVTYTVGSLVARSELRDSLYFFCQPGGTSGTRLPGQSSLIRLDIDPNGDQAAAATFKTSVFPVSGSYQDGQNTGIGAFDPVTDRFIVQSRAPVTPGAWVFDGRLEAWVGFITAPDSFNKMIAVNPTTGRHYMGGQQDEGQDPENAYLNISDARLSPVPQGETIPLSNGTGLGTRARPRIAIHGSTQRLFTNRVGPDEQIAVLEDMTPVQGAEEALDFDALTSDVPIEDASMVQYSGGSGGYGASIRMAGGLAAGHSGPPKTTAENLRAHGIDGMPPCVSQDVVNVSCISGGDREVTIGSVPSVDFRSTGASARATALESDPNTDAERDGLRRELRDRTDKEEDGLSSGLQPPFGRVDCLDGGGDRQQKKTPEHPLGYAEVICDLAKDEVTATSTFGDIASQPVAISSSSYESTAFRSSKLGSVTKSLATARGVRLGEPAGMHVSIAAVKAEATTVAAGRPGTTSATWKRSLSGISAQDADGTEIFSAPGCSTVIEAGGGKKTTTTSAGDCDEVVKQLNAALNGRVELRLPRPEIEATPKGAFAAVNKTQRDYLQASTMQNDERKAIPGLEAIVLYDGEEKSRTVVQLAGVQSNSIFTINNFGGYDFVDPGPVDTGGDTGAPVDTGSTGTGDTATGGVSEDAPLDDSFSDGAFDDAVAADAFDAGIPPVVTGPIVHRVAEGLRWLARSPGEAALVGAMWLLFGGALMATVRRLLLLRELQN